MKARKIRKDYKPNIKALSKLKNKDAEQRRIGSIRARHEEERVERERITEMKKTDSQIIKDAGGENNG